MLINEKDTELNNYKFKWSTIDNNGLYKDLEETTDQNNDYNTKKTLYDVLDAKRKRGDALLTATQAELDQYEKDLKEYETIQRVEKNKVINIDLSNIHEYTDFTCSVYLSASENILIGSKTVRVKNTVNVDGKYSLYIENGTQTFHYDSNGLPPTNKGLENPLTLKNLKIKIVDDQNRILSDKILKTCEIK
jgi:hypothetical protein